MQEKLSWFDRMMAAVTFAEADEPEVGRELADGITCKSEKKQRCEECSGVLGTDLQGAEAQS